MLTADELLTATAAPPEPDQRVTRPAPQRRTPRHFDLLVVGCLVVLAFGLRVPTITRYYWVDEGISVGIASHSLTQIPHLLTYDGSPPLWYFLVHFWMEMFGSTPLATHSFSLLWSLLAIPLAYFAARSVWGPTAGRYAAALAATNPFLNWYATEDRMYTMVVCLSLAAMGLLARAVKTRRPAPAIGAAACLLAACYTHNWGLYMAAAAGAYLLVFGLWRKDRQLVAWTLALGTAVVLAYLPWVPQLFHQAAVTAAPWAVPPQITDLFADPSTLLGGTIGVLVCPILAAACVWTRWRGQRRPNRFAVIVAQITVLATVAGWLAAQFEPSWTVRYLAVTDGGWILAIAGTLASEKIGRRAIQACCGLMVVWAVVGMLLPNAHPLDAKDNAASIAAAASPHLKTGDLVVVTQTEQVPVLAHYLPGGLTYLNPMGRVSDPFYVNWTNIVSRLQRANDCQTIQTWVNKLPVGANILEVDPLDPVGASGSAWSVAAHKQVENIERLLGSDSGLVPVRSFIEATSPKPYSPLVGEMFTKVGPTTAVCK